jgi:hypothetical protein
MDGNQAAIGIDIEVVAFIAIGKHKTDVEIRNGHFSGELAIYQHDLAIPVHIDEKVKDLAPAVERGAVQSTVFRNGAPSSQKNNQSQKELLHSGSAW